MYQWASLCLLAIVHYLVVAHQILSAAYKRLLPGFACRVSTGIRPVAPKCIALALNDAALEDDDLQHLGDVLEWCATAGMRHAIVYCGQGDIAQVSSSLPVLRVFCKGKVGLRPQVDQTATVQQPDLTVSLLSAEASLAPLISAVTAPAHKSGSLHAAGHQFQTAVWLDKQMQQTDSSKLALTEPDLMLVFGKAFTLGGYPPWPIRVTEMYHMGRLRCVSCSQLQTALQQYCNTLQRFGT